MKNSTFQKLTVYLNNTEHKNNFQTTYTYHRIQNLTDAINVVRTMHSEPSDSRQDITRKINKAVFNGQKINVFSHENSQTNNGWIVK